ncbi:hypothetical protein ACQP0C_12860 [Nocardia sp. CA-129566]|uniref:hypothetical protein n=1 Tax=Nocardia sp. CA-129566 TaxID=3239976 RepID=UPI003D98747D
MTKTQVSQPDMDVARVGQLAQADARTAHGETVIVTPPRVCERGDVQLAHEQMRIHRACRSGQCVWKSAAFYTLVSVGCLVPQSMSPRERAAARGIAYPPLEDVAYRAGDGPPLRTLQEVVDRLVELAAPVSGRTTTAG